AAEDDRLQRLVVSHAGERREDPLPFGRRQSSPHPMPFPERQRVTETVGPDVTRLANGLRLCDLRRLLRLGVEGRRTVTSTGGVDAPCLLWLHRLIVRWAESCRHARSRGIGGPLRAPASAGIAEIQP